jgi:hypothetical protein
MHAIKSTVVAVVILAGISLILFLTLPKERKAHPPSSYSNSTEVAVVVR